MQGGLGGRGGATVQCWCQVPGSSLQVCHECTQVPRGALEPTSVPASGLLLSAPTRRDF